METKKKEITRKLVHAGGWQVVKRVAKTIPFGGTAVVIVLVGSDIRNKGVVKGLVNSGLDAIPFVGLAKNAVELVRGDFIADKKKEKQVVMRSHFHDRLLAAALFLGSLAIAGNAQSTKAKPKPLATPPVLTGAEIISRADDQIQTPPVSQPADKPAEKAAPNNAARIKELTDRIQKLESEKSNSYDEKQKRMVLNLDILTRAEQRSESLRKQLFEMIEKENAIKARLDQIETDMRPEMIERSLQLNGSMRPEEVRENKRKSLAAEKANLQSLLNDIQSTRANLNTTLQKSDIMVEKLRTKLEKDIDDSFLKDDGSDQ